MVTAMHALMKRIRDARKKKHENKLPPNVHTGPPQVIVMEDHKSWGNAIQWRDYEKQQLWGHLTPRPAVGDEVLCELKSGRIGVFKIIDVDYTEDPQDMFFATTEPIGYLDEVAAG
jgi:hypothetical protein